MRTYEEVRTALKKEEDEFMVACVLNDLEAVNDCRIMINTLRWVLSDWETKL